MWTYVHIGALTLVAVWLSSVQCHPGRPVIPDDPLARAIFMVAETNRTPDGFLTVDEMSDIFMKFDINGDGIVDETEFIAHWSILHLGDLDHAITLFHRADTNKDGRISREPDYTRLFYYFDRDMDGKISEAEFVNVWFSLSS
ncbi:insoluble matrix shell protein 5-like isoform X1 [Ruditapes philippinarum]|uniref:insoluble matrix shell protein 5-like isoform X1 n=1 Tax=Ruditapes philippinarum TaxID=129788 RepID=UPI00295AE4E2|nr:insoluble matrix shell protein 5-like isoform X1 [Ruditapes philippinarum]